MANFFSRSTSGVLLITIDERDRAADLWDLVYCRPAAQHPSDGYHLHTVETNNDMKRGRKGVRCYTYTPDEVAKLLKVLNDLSQPSAPCTPEVQGEFAQWHDDLKHWYYGDPDEANQPSEAK